MNNPHYSHIKEAIENALKGDEPLTKEELVQIAKEILDKTGDVYKVDNITEMGAGLLKEHELHLQQKRA